MEQLAALGGPPAVRSSVPALSTARRLNIEAVHSSSGEPSCSALDGSGAIQTTERAFRTRTGACYAVALSSGTAALLVGLHAVGIRRYDDVLVPSYDWPSATAAVLALGARPVPVDADAVTGALSLASARSRRTARTRAIVVTHLAGRPADIVPLTVWARAEGLRSIEDCAQALGASVDGRSVGTFADVGAFSLGPGKLVDAGEGGMLVTSDPDVYAAAVRYSQHPLYQQLHGVEPDTLHLNFRMHPLAAVVASGELAVADARLRRLRGSADTWMSALGASPGIILPSLVPGADASWWKFTLRLAGTGWPVSAETVVAALQAEGVPIAAGPTARTICSILSDEFGVDSCCPGAELWRSFGVELPLPDPDAPGFGEFCTDVARAHEKVWTQRAKLAELAS